MSRYKEITSVMISTQTVENTTDEITVFTASIPANSLKAADILKLYGSGEITAASASDTVTIRIKLGGTTIATITSPAKVLNDECFHMEGIATVHSIGASGVLAWHVDLVAEEGHSDDCDETTIDTTSAGDITVTVQWNAAKSGNIFKFEQGFLEWKNRW